MKFNLMSLKIKSDCLVSVFCAVGLLTFGGLSCSTAPLPRSPLVDQMLRPRPAYKPHLTNQIKDKYGKVEVAVYDLSNENVRKTLIDLKFICRFLDKRYYICPDAPAICRNTFKIEKGGIFSKDKRIKQVHSMRFEEHYDLFVSAKLVCFSQESYPWDSY